MYKCTIQQASVEEEGALQAS